MNDTRTMPAPIIGAPIIGVLGAGVSGQAVGHTVSQRRMRTAWFDVESAATRRAIARFGGVAVESMDELAVTDVVVVATPSPQAHLVTELMLAGTDVVCIADDPHDVQMILDLEPLVIDLGRRLVVGAAMAPGVSGLLARHLAAQLAQVDEIHIATHGTGGPACARQHHRALGSRATAWHDDAWLERPGGSGRELVWFPEPIGPADCYRAALADPVLLHRAFPEAVRISARVSATRRDRLTARLPLLTPPHRGGDRGAVRVEVRGADAEGGRTTLVAGAVGRSADIAGAVAGLYAECCATGMLGPGLHLAGAPGAPTDWLLARASEAGVLLQEYTGLAREQEPA